MDKLRTCFIQINHSQSKYNCTIRRSKQCKCSYLLLHYIHIFKVIISITCFLISHEGRKSVNETAQTSFLKFASHVHTIHSLQRAGHSPNFFIEPCSRCIYSLAATYYSTINYYQSLQNSKLYILHQQQLNGTSSRLIVCVYHYAPCEALTATGMASRLLDDNTGMTLARFKELRVASWALGVQPKLLHPAGLNRCRE